MPIYEYTCTSCGTKFDVMRSMKDSDNAVNCIKCNSSSTHRIQSACFSQSQGSSHSSTGSCSGCSGGSCSTCGH